MKLFAVVIFLLYASQDSLTVKVEVYDWAQSVVLPCQYDQVLEELVTVKWSRFDLSPDIVHLRQEGDDELAQNQLFRGRTSMRLDAQDFGNFSLTLREPQPSDSGEYICSIIDEEEEILSDIQLNVKEIFPTWAKVLLVLLVLLAVSGGLLFHFRHYFMSVYKVEVDPGVESVLLPFKTTVRLPEGVTVKWRNSSGRMVHSNYRGQHRLYRDRTKMKEKLKSGDFSLTLKNPTDRDTDIYTCTVYKRSSDEILTEKQVLLNVKAGAADSFIIAIDFGSGYSGYAFNVRPREEGGGTQLKRWGEELGLDSPKTPTCILFDGNFWKFGYEAKTAYKKMRREEAEKHLFFEDFKRRIRTRDDWWERIYAANDNNYSMKALNVFKLVLRFLKNDALKTINVHPEGGKFTASDFTWVLTVPAVWKDSAEEFMVEAAIEAGLVTEDTKEKLMLVLEPEAALTWCLKLPSDGFFTQNHSRDSQDPSPGPTDAGTSCNDPPGSQVAVHFEKEPEETKVLLETQNRDGKRYLVVDCGDKSVDFTVLEVLEGGTLKKLQEASRDDLGGRTVDWKFKQFLGEIFSDGVWKEYEENFPSEVQKMMYDFIRLKQVDEDVQISCPDNLREQAQKKKEIETFFDSVEGASWDEGVIRISREKLRSFFDESLQDITKSLREELQEDLNIGSIVLVGGFAESQILRQHITDQFGPQHKVLCPLRPQEAVLKGAVELGRNPKLVSSQKKGPACLNWFS